MKSPINLRATQFAMAILCLSGCTLSWAQDETALALELFVSAPTEINVTSVLISGPSEMMVVCAQGTRSSANRLADRIEETGRELKYIFLTHAHFDHHQGAAILKQRFPDARFIASPEVGRLQRVRAPYDDQFAAQNLGDNAAVPSIPVEDYADGTITIDGETVEIWKGIVGDVGFGYPDEPHVALFIPSLNTLLPSDAVYFDAHVFMGGSSTESRALWVKQLESWLERGFDRVIPGHMPESSLPELGPDDALEHTRDYILAYDKAVAEAPSSDALIAAMLEAYPDLKHRQGLYLSAFFDFYEFRSITYDSNGVPVAGPGPKSAEEAQAQRDQYDALRKAYNPEPATR
ncbi:MAG: MBL fold metallo-hydrolase [Pseudomonadota bacterium]